MADTKLNDMTSLPSDVAATDLLYVVRSATDYKATASQLTSVGGVAISGTSTPTLAVTGTTTVSGANTGDQTTAVLAASVVADTALVIGSGGARGVAASTLTADWVKATSGVPAAVAIDGTTAEVVVGRSTASSGAPELLATTGTRGTAVVLATSPTLVTPAIGTPSAGVLSSCTDYPVASTSRTGAAPQATAPGAGLISVLAIANGETVRTDKAIFDTTNPADIGTASPGTQLLAARRDHVHAIPSAYVTNTMLATAAKTFKIGQTWDGGGSAIATGKGKGFIVCPVGATIVAWTMTADQGTPVVKTWKIAAGTAKPTATDSISTSGVGLSSGTSVRSTTLTDFTTATVTANDIITFNLEGNTGSATEITFSLELTRT